MSSSVAVKRILFAMELADITKQIAPWVDYMGRRMEADIHVIHVIPKLAYYAVPYASDPIIMDDEEALLKKGKEKVRAACKEMLESEPTKVHVVIGDPVDVIVDTIKSENISLVIMGTHGRRGLDRALFGSVADRVLRFSPVPVCCVNPCPH